MVVADIVEIVDIVVAADIAAAADAVETELSDLGTGVEFVVLNVAASSFLHFERRKIKTGESESEAEREILAVVLAVSATVSANQCRSVVGSLHRLSCCFEVAQNEMMLDENLQTLKMMTPQIAASAMIAIVWIEWSLVLAEMAF